jgi:hypothetical protein
MQTKLVSFIACAAALLTASSAHAGWTWKKAENPNTAAASGLRLPLDPGGSQTGVACRVTVNSAQMLGMVVDGACEYKTAMLAGVEKKSAPNYDYLASDGEPTSIRITPSVDGFIPLGVVRAQAGEQGPVLCLSNGKIGWVTSAGSCMLNSGMPSAQYNAVVTTPTTGLSEKPPLWRDLNSTGGTAGVYAGPGSSSFCRASLTASGTKIAPGVFSPAGGGKCVYVESVDGSGVAKFAQTTDKSRFLVLFSPTVSTEKLLPMFVETRGQLMIGVSGNDKVMGCTTRGGTPKPGVYLRDKCVLPPSSGSGNGAAQPGQIQIITVFLKA